MISSVFLRTFCSLLTATSFFCVSSSLADEELISSIDQVGAMNKASIQQKFVAGSSNSDDANRAMVSQHGLNNAADIRQDGNSLNVTVDQNGANHRADITQYGSDQNAQILQSGQGKSAIVVQDNIYGGAPQSVFINQH